MDLRFEVLLRETVNNGKMQRYVARRLAGDKAAQVPDLSELPEVKLFNRLGQKVEKKGGKFYDEMTPEQINKRMRAVGTKMKGKSK